MSAKVIKVASEKISLCDGDGLEYFKIQQKSNRDFEDKCTHVRLAANCHMVTPMVWFQELITREDTLYAN